MLGNNPWHTHIFPGARLENALHIARRVLPRRVAAASGGHCEKFQLSIFLCMQQQQQGPSIIAAAIAVEYGESLTLVFSSGHGPLSLYVSLGLCVCACVCICAGWFYALLVEVATECSPPCAVRD